MIVVHHLERSRSERIVWLLEEMKLSYEIKRYERNKRTMLASPALREVHPLGKAPIVVDDGVVLIESGAIIDTLITRHGGGSGSLRPEPGTPEHVAYTTFLHFAEGSLMPPLLIRLIFNTMKQKSPALVRPAVALLTSPLETLYVGPTLGRILAFLEGELASRPWFAGAEFSAADIQMSFPLLMAKQRGGLDGRFPKLLDWLARIAERPARQAAMSRLGEG